MSLPERCGMSDNRERKRGGRMFFYVSKSSPFVRKTLQKIIISKQKAYQENQNNQNHENKKGVVSLQTNHLFSVILHKPIQTCKRISLCFFSKDNQKAASMTVEAALVLPLFLFALMNLMSFIEIYRMQGNMNMKLHQTAKEMAVMRAAVTITDEEECVDLLYPYVAEPFVPIVGFDDFWMFSRMRTRAWTGYDNEAAKEEAEEIVYVTQYGEVYHSTKSCSYLKLSIRAVDSKLVDELRNADGECFRVCEKCGVSVTNTVFVTSYGNRYHTTLCCEGIKRIVKEIPISQVGSREPCKKCN